jgi:hypothetical protein
MEGLRVAIYESLGDTTGRPCTFDELVAYVSRFSRDSVLWTCCHTSIALRLFDGASHGWSEYSWLTKLYFSKPLAIKLEIGYWSQTQRLAFHRRQLLLIAKLALIHCKPTGLDAGIPKNGFALTCLMANDHLHHGVMPSGEIQIDSRHDFAALVTEMLAMQEFGGHLRPETVIRAYQMFVTCPTLLASHPDYIAIDEALLEATGLSYSKILAITIGFISRYVTLKPEELRKNARLIATIPDYLAPLKIPGPQLVKYMELISGDPLILKRELAETPSSNTDITIFRKYPLIDRWFDVGTTNQRLGHLPLDIELWWQKVYTAPFWFLSAKFKRKFNRFWGAVFEQYAHTLLQPNSSNRNAQFIRNPSSPRNANEELCDAVIVENDALVLIEYKSVLIRADVKYSGDVESLSLHLQSKFVRDRSTKKPKAIAQLAKAAKLLFAGERPEVPWADLEKIRRCYMLVVTLDDIGETFAMSPFLETFMREELDRSQCPHITIRPVFCINIGTVERISPSLIDGSLISILERWYLENPALSMPLLSIQMKDLIVPRSADDWNQWAAAMDVAKHELFDDETIAAGTPFSDPSRLPHP